MKTMDSPEGELLDGAVFEEGEGTIADFRVAELLLLDPKQFASIFSLNLRSELRWRRDNTVPHINIRGRIYYTLADVMDALKNFRSNTINQNQEK